MTRAGDKCMISSGRGPAENVMLLQLLITKFTLSYSDEQQKRNLTLILDILRKLRDQAPTLSKQLSKDLQQTLLDIEPKLRIVGYATGALSAFVAFVGVIMSALCEDKNARRVGRDMARIGGSVAAGTLEIVCTIKEVAAEIKLALPS